MRLASQVDEGNYYEKVDRWNPDPAGHVIELSIGEQRVWDMPFRRVR